ncbi:MAG: zinc ribbon domain-containing protein [Oscillospiraceae bacterium]|jgi:hypothetical protein|nr:zinc ribbon domain-containing protein [Oscillospiraceae bacterium]
MFCPKCGNQVDDGVLTCPSCGEYIGSEAAAPNAAQAPQTPPPYQQAPYQQQPYQPYPPQPQQNPADVPNTGLNVLSCFFPIIGIILYFVWKDQTPLKAKKVLKWGLIGLGVIVGLWILFAIISAVLAATASYY